MMNAYFFQRLDRLDEIIAAGPSDVDYEKDIAPLLQERASEEYFYSHIASPGWLSPLWDSGVFEHVPQAEKDEDQGVVRFPGWPAAHYLPKIAAETPTQVANIIRGLPGTDNVRVQGQLINVLLLLPVESCMPLLDTVEQWLTTPYRKHYSDEIGQLIVQFSKAGEQLGSLKLARAALALTVPETQEHAGKFRGSDVHARFDSWSYERLLENQVPQLLDVIGIPVLILLTDLLESGVSIAASGRQNTARDHSEVWHPHIGSDHRGSDLRSALVRTTRDSGRSLLERGGCTLPDLVAVFDAKARQVFERLTLFLLNHDEGLEAVQVVEARLLRKDYLHNPHLYPEYLDLLGEWFSKISSESQEKLLDWIDEGPDLHSYRIFQRDYFGRQIGEEELEGYAARWKRDRLAALGDDLPEAANTLLSRLQDEVGEPRPLIQSDEDGVWMGPSSPKDRSELSDMGVEDLIAFLKDWDPNVGPRQPTVEGLSRELTEAVRERASSISENALEFAELRDEYLAAFLRGLKEAVKSKDAIAWAQVLQFCEYVLFKRGQGDGRVDRTARMAIVDLLEAGLSSDTQDISFDNRNTIWQLLEGLAEDADPQATQGEATGGYDAYTEGINSVRGRALAGVVNYCLWVRKHYGTTTDNTEFKGMEDLPEARRVLTRHLDPQEESSLAVRAMYGRWFPWLVLLDKDWAQDYAEKIFPLEPQQARFWRVAWDTYLAFCRPYNDVVPILERQYEQAVRELAELEQTSVSNSEPGERLAQHLMTFYWRGLLDLRRDGLVRSFFEHASRSSKAHAIEFIGRSLMNTDDVPDEEIVGRLYQLWEYRLTAAREGASRADHSEELGAFVTWCAASAFPLDRANVARLKRTIVAGAKIEHWYGLTERLADAVYEMPGQIVELLAGLVTRSSDRWALDLWQREAKQILRVAIEVGDEDTRASAVEVADLFGREGHLDFREIFDSV